MPSLGEQLIKKVLIPGRHVATGPYSVLALAPTQEMAGHVLDRGEVRWRVLIADVELIVPKDHVHHPVQAVFNPPVAASGFDLRGACAIVARSGATPHRRWRISLTGWYFECPFFWRASFRSRPTSTIDHNN